MLDIPHTTQKLKNFFRTGDNWQSGRNPFPAKIIGLVGSRHPAGKSGGGSCPLSGSSLGGEVNPKRAACLLSAARGRVAVTFQVLAASLTGNQAVLGLWVRF